VTGRSHRIDPRCHAVRTERRCCPALAAACGEASRMRWREWPSTCSMVGHSPGVAEETCRRVIAVSVNQDPARGCSSLWSGADQRGYIRLGLMQCTKIAKTEQQHSCRPNPGMVLFALIGVQKLDALQRAPIDIAIRPKGAQHCTLPSYNQWDRSPAAAPKRRPFRSRHLLMAGKKSP
jgi:hypothetical protein